jgi:hypothetical protein
LKGDPEGKVAEKPDGKQALYFLAQSHNVEVVLAKAVVYISTLNLIKAVFLTI